MEKILFLKIIRFLISGIVATAANLSTLYFLTEYLRIWYIFSGTVAFLCGVSVSFVLQRFWTFKDLVNDFSTIYLQIFFYFLLAGINAIINAFLLYGFAELLGWHYLVGQIIAGGIVAIESYFFYQIIFYGKKSL